MPHTDLIFAKFLSWQSCLGNGVTRGCWAAGYYWSLLAPDFSFLHAPAHSDVACAIAHKILRLASVRAFYAPWLLMLELVCRDLHKSWARTQVQPVKPL